MPWIVLTLHAVDGGRYRVLSSEIRAGIEYAARVVGVADSIVALEGRKERAIEVVDVPGERLLTQELDVVLDLRLVAAAGVGVVLGIGPGLVGASERPGNRYGSRGVDKQDARRVGRVEVPPCWVSEIWISSTMLEPPWPTGRAFCPAEGGRTGSWSSAPGWR